MSSLEVLEKLIHTDPPPLGDDVPVSLRLLIEKALEKDPAERYQSIRDLVVDLRRLLRGRVADRPRPAVPSPSRTNAASLAVAATLGALFVSLALGILYWRLIEADYLWTNPLEGARFEKLTDWPGTELDAAISHDGKFVAFLSDRDGLYDMWVTQVSGGEFRNLTGGQRPTLLHEMTRTTGFNADGSQVWLRAGLVSLPGPAPRRGATLSLLPTLGGAARPFLTPASLNPVWSDDGTMLVFHHSTPGDPITIAEPDGQNERPIHTGFAGEHNHYVTVSPDKQHIYFVRNWRSTEADIWRVAVTGGTPERLTYHNSHVAYPVLLDNRTLVYRGTGSDGTAWVLYGMDVERRIPHQISRGVEDDQSVAASADGRRLAVTVSNPVVQPVDRAHHRRRLPTSRRPGACPYRRRRRKARGTRRRWILLHLAARAAPDGIWRWKDGSAVELWGASSGAVIAAPGVASNGALAFGVRRNGRTTLHVASAGRHRRAAGGRTPGSARLPVLVPGRTLRRRGRRYRQRPPYPSVYPSTVVHPNSSPNTSPPMHCGPAMGRRFSTMTERPGGAFFPVRGLRLDKSSVTLPEFSNRGDWEGFRFTSAATWCSCKATSATRISGSRTCRTGEKRQLTNLKTGYSVRSFDISADGKEILFDRVQENSDIVLIRPGPMTRRPELFSVFRVFALSRPSCFVFSCFRACLYLASGIRPDLEPHHVARLDEAALDVPRVKHIS